MKIHVRKTHIEKGKAGAPQECPIALAICEVTYITPTVCNGAIYSHGYRYAASRKVQRFIEDFDSGKPVKPFAFVLK